MQLWWLLVFVAISQAQIRKPKEIIHENSTTKDAIQGSNLNFPHNLAVIFRVLQKLDNEKCVEDTQTVLEAMSNEERWSLEMFDSFSKFPTGILYGNYYQLGNFDECIGVLQPSEEHPIKGQYCLTKARINKPLNSSLPKNRHKFTEKILKWGICMPSSCTPKEATIFVSEIFKSVAEHLGDITVEVSSKDCQISSSKPWTSLELVWCCIMSGFFLFTIASTLFHCWFLRQRKQRKVYNIEGARQKNHILTDLILCFSIVENMEKLLQVKPSELNLESIAGIKFISMMFIIGGHSLIFLVGGPIDNLIFPIEESVKLKNGLFYNNVLLVDTFLMVSGFLLCRLLILEFEKRKGRLNFFILYIGRYIRLTPAYFVVISLYVTVLHRLGSGPLWHGRVNLEMERCSSSWWSNLLYINNYVQTEQICMFQSWYLAVDYHLFIIAPFFVYALWKWNKIGEGLLFITMAVTAIIPFILTYINNWDPTFLAYAPEVEDLTKNYYFKSVYIKTHMRASSYFIGLACGYLVHKLQSAGTKISSMVVWFGWIVSAICGLISMFSIVVFYSPQHESNALESAIYASLHRIAWSLAVGWVILVCVTDNAAIINKFLSWKVFIPLSRLTYCAYLTNGIVEIYNIGVIRQPTYLSIYELVCKCLAHLLITFAGALILCIFFESPLHGLERVMKRRDQTDREQRHNTSTRPMEDS